MESFYKTRRDLPLGTTYTNCHNKGEDPQRKYTDKSDRLRIGRKFWDRLSVEETLRETLRDPPGGEEGLTCVGDPEGDTTDTGWRDKDYRLLPDRGRVAGVVRSSISKGVGGPLQTRGH